MLDRRGLLIANSQQGGVLPQGYTQVNYLESTGTQYINTGVLANNNTVTEIVADWQNWIGTSPNGVELFGVRSGDNTYYELLLDNTNPSVYYQFGNSTPSVSATLGSKKTYKAGKNVLYVDGISVGSANMNTFSNSYGLTLFALNNKGNYEREAKAKIYSAKIWDDTTLVRDLIPCLDNNNVPCMYDTISKQTFYNAGTGEFLYG